MDRPTATGKGRVEAVLGKEQVSLKDLGELIASTENGMDYERIVTEKMEGMHLEVHGLKDEMQRSMACVGRSTDNVVCDLTPIVEFQGNVLIGVASTLDAVLTSLPVMRRQLNGLHLNVFADSLADIPAKTKISTANMSTEWKVERQGPFVETGLKEMLKLWEGRDVSGYGGGLKGIATAFYRQYFRSACRPATMIQSYSCRQGRNRGKDKNLKDLPEGILHNLIGVVLDSGGLEKAELDMTAEELKAAPTDFWRSLGENDNDREEQLRKLRDCRAGWKAHLRGCVGSALAEVRVSPCENDVLTPRKRRARSSLSVSATPTMNRY